MFSLASKAVRFVRIEVSRRSTAFPGFSSRIWIITSQKVQTHFRTVSFLAAATAASKPRACREFKPGARGSYIRDARKRRLGVAGGARSQMQSKTTTTYAVIRSEYAMRKLLSYLS